MSTTRTGSRRPTSVLAATLLLALAAGIAGLCGLAMSWVSGIDGHSESAPALLGIVSAVGCLVAAIATWRGTWSAPQVLAAAALVPLLCLAGSFGSADLATATVASTIGWLVLAWVLMRPGARAWRGSYRA